jgi:transketolase
MTQNNKAEIEELYELVASIKSAAECRELFEAQPLSYRESVIPGTCEKRVIVEAGVKFGWERYQVNSATTRYVTLDTFGASGPYKALAQEFGFTADNVFEKARELL